MLDVSFSCSILFCEHERNEDTLTIPFYGPSCISDYTMEEVSDWGAEKILHVGFSIMVFWYSNTWMISPPCWILLHVEFSMRPILRHVGFSSTCCKCLGIMEIWLCWISKQHDVKSPHHKSCWRYKLCRRVDIQNRRSILIIGRIVLITRKSLWWNDFRLVKMGRIVLSSICVA